MAEEKKGWLRGAADKVEAKVENQRAQQATNEAKAGNLILERQFGLSRVAIYENGFVRVGRGGLNVLTGLSPYEILKSIKYGEQIQDRSAFGAAWNGPFASSQRRTLALTIVTDRKVHTLATEGQMLSGDDKAGRALEAAGQVVIGAVAASGIRPSMQASAGLGGGRREQESAPSSGAAIMGWTPPPSWPAPPEGWEPAEGWQPDPAWGPAPRNWNFWPAREVCRRPTPGVAVPPGADVLTSAPVMGHKTDKVFAKKGPVLLSLLAPYERLEGLFIVNGLSPMVDLMIVTDQQLMLVSTSDAAIRPKLVVPFGAIASVHYSGMLDKLHVKHRTGIEQTLPSVPHQRDKDAILSLIGRVSASFEAVALELGRRSEAAPAPAAPAIDAATTPSNEPGVPASGAAKGVSLRKPPFPADVPPAAPITGEQLERRLMQLERIHNLHSAGAITDDVAEQLRSEALGS